MINPSDAETPSDPLAPVRDWASDRIRRLVVGPGHRAQRARHMADAESGWFEPGSVIREVHADASMFVGGIRAVLLQSLHPLAMAGVADHSEYRTDPWGRLQRTSRFLAATTFGSAAEAQRAVDTVRRVHERVVGAAPDGRPYAANDPHLMLWVHVAEVDSFLAAHRRYGRRRLDPAESDAYVEQTAVVARRLGVVDPPVTVAELNARLAAFRPELEATPAARRAAWFLLVAPPVSLTARPAYFALAGAAVSLLPVWARVPLRLPVLPVAERLVTRPVGDLVTRVLRWSLEDPAA